VDEDIPGITQKMKRSKNEGRLDNGGYVTSFQEGPLAEVVVSEQGLVLL
jgi:hypothetical protein